MQAAGLRIAVVTETFAPEVNGVAMTLGRIVEGLRLSGHTVQLIRPRQEHESAEAPPPGLEQVLTTGFPVPTYRELRFGLPSRARLLKLWQARRPDVVHMVTEGPLGWSAVGAASELRLPITSSYHTNFQSYSGHYGIGLLRKPIEAYLRKLHNRTLVTMVPTHAVLQDLQSQGYQNLALLSRGVDTGLFHPQQRSNALRQRWGAGPDDLVCINVGRLAKEKNVETVVAAFEAIQSRLPKAKLVFVGDGPLRKRLEQSCPAAIFAGVQKDQALAEHYASGDLFLFPSLTETFGNVVPEALASGLAVVSYAKAAAQELITPGQDGVLVSVGTSVDFVRAAAELAVQPLQMAQLRAQAPASVQQLSWQAIHQRFADILSSAISQHGESLAARAIRAPALSLPSA